MVIYNTTHWGNRRLFTAGGGPSKGSTWLLWGLRGSGSSPQWEALLYSTGWQALLCVLKDAIYKNVYHWMCITPKPKQKEWKKQLQWAPAGEGITKFQCTSIRATAQQLKRMSLDYRGEFQNHNVDYGKPNAKEHICTMIPYVENFKTNKAACTYIPI